MIQADLPLYAGLLPLATAPRFNAYFARAVLEGRAKGAVYVDNPGLPRTAYILHPCGMSLLCGSTASATFTDALVDYMLDTARTRRGAELAQAFPDAWHGILQDRLGPRLLRASDPGRTGLDFAGIQSLGKGRVIEWGRVNFEFDRAAFGCLRETALPAGLRLERAGRAVFSPWQGPVMPRFFWDSPESFERDGVAFSVFEGKRPLCVAFSAWIVAGVLEIGIETHPDARGRGLACAACAALIRHALSRGLEPVWSTHSENRASQSLALRLGFRRTVVLPYYGLVAHAG